MPIIRFDTGDLGRWCGENRFELLGRVGEEMKVGGAWISYRTIYDAVSEVCSPLALQLRISASGAAEKLEIKIESTEKLDTREVIDTILTRLREKNDAFLGEFLSKGSLKLNMEVLPPGALERVEKTGKVRRIVDLRGHF
jgi:phenylacetate-coenzyme A ligase PaaK-like adenylate-forming protein